MSEIVTLTCITLITNGPDRGNARRVRSTVRVSREDWDEMPEDGREWKRHEVRAMHAGGLRKKTGMVVDPATLVVTVGVEKFLPSRPTEESTACEEI